MKKKQSSILGFSRCYIQGVRWMPRLTSEDYRDYVIKDGKFVGAFEEMYRNCPDPWHQDSMQPLAEDIALLLLSKRRYERVLDIGCGKGRFTNRLKAATGASVAALDISQTAIRIAQSRYPGIEFLVAAVPPLLHFPDKSFDLVVSAELLWYMLPNLSVLFAEINRVLQLGGHYLIIQQFYKPEEQKYGREVMQSPEDLFKMLPFQLVHHVEVDRLSNYKLVALVEKVS
jgi:SAM-dependent methyltransferase